MQNSKLNLAKPGKLSFVSIFLIFLLLFTACKKADIPNNFEKKSLAPKSSQFLDFFTISENAPNAIRVIVKEMQKQLKENDVKDFLNWHGQPVWNKIIKFEKDKNGLTTYAIPTQKSGTITGFFAITFDKDNIKFEMHRENAIKLKKAEYTYSNINLTVSKNILDIFSNNPKLQNTEETNSLRNCFWIWILNETFQKESTSNMTIGGGDPGGYWEWHCEVMGGGPGGGGDPGGGGGGGSGGGTGGCGGGGGNTETFTSKWWSNEASILSPCELTEVVNRLAYLLGLNTLQRFFLLQFPGITEQIDSYVGTGGNQQNNQIAYYHINRITQDFDYFNFNLIHFTTGDPLKVWWVDDTFLTPYGGLNFGSWAINYINQNPTVSFAVFQNQFMGVSEGHDGVFDATYWGNPSLTFPQQNLPTWSDFKANFPLDSDPLYNTPDKIYNSVGGTVASLYTSNPLRYQNTCALRLSKALNYSGVIIPNILNKTFEGADNKFYFLSAYEMNLWMRKTFGTNPATATTPLNTNHYHYTGTQAGVHGANLPSLLNGKKGIYSLYSSDFNWASGHADLLNSNSTCGNNCHFNGPIAYIDVWVLN